MAILIKSPNQGGQLGPFLIPPAGSPPVGSPIGVGSPIPPNSSVVDTIEIPVSVKWLCRVYDLIEENAHTFEIMTHAISSTTKAPYVRNSCFRVGVIDFEIITSVKNGFLQLIFVNKEPHEIRVILNRTYLSA